MAQENPYLQLVQGDLTGSVKSAMQVAADKNPDVEAKLLKLAKSANVPLEVARLDQPAVERKVAMESLDYKTLAEKYPSTAQLLSDPISASLAKDDVHKLSFIEDSLNFGANFGRALAASIPKASASIYGAVQAPLDVSAELIEPMVGRILPGNPFAAISDKLGEWRKTANADAAAIRGNQAGMGFIQKSALSGAESLGQNLLLTPASVLSGNPMPMLAGMTAMTGGDAYGQARDAGVSVPGSLAFASSQAMIEYATEKLPAIYLLRDIGLKSSVKKMLFNQAATELPGEQVATVLQDMNEWAVLHPEQPFSAYLAERPSAAAQTLIATMVATGGQIAITKAADRLANGPREKQAVDILNALKDGVLDSKTFERAPERVKDFIAKHTANGPMENIFIPAEQLQSYFQTVQIDPAAAAAEMGAKNYAEALATGGDVVIPLAEFITSTAKTPHYDGLVNDIRFVQGEMTAREAELYEKNHPDEIRRMVEDAQKTRLPDLDIAPAITQMTDDITGQLVAGGMEQGTAASYAQTYAKVMNNLAERSGMDPMALHQQYGMQIVRPMADVLTNIGTSDIQIDPLLDMLRSGQGPSAEQINGPSLIEFIRSIGGVNDAGGELRQMEVDKNKAPFVRNLAQLTGRGIDEVTALANESGYQVRDLLAAIEAEIAGNPTYSVNNINEQAQGLRRDLESLVDYLQQLGIDLDSTSNEDVRKAMAAAVGTAYDQGAVDESTGLPLNQDGTVTVYHHTSAANAELIRKTGKLKAQAEPDVYVTTRNETDTGYGDTAVAINVDPSLLQIDDEFPDGRVDYRIDAGKPGGSVPVKFPHTTRTLDELKADIAARYPDVKFDLFGSGNKLTLSRIVVPKDGRNAGAGTAIMQDVVDFADDNGMTVVLSPSKDFGGTVSRLKEFYKRFGFVENKGKNKDYAISESMYREPKKTTLNQQYNKEKRGYIQFGADRKFKIALLENADLSTFLHETGHFWLEVMGDLATGANASEQIKADYAAILKFLKVESREQIGVDQHEMFARANEAYLMEGKAPSPELRAVFQRFKAWLTMIYKSMEALNVKLSDEVRGVFNRIYAADAEIEAAQDELDMPALFATAQDAGMTEQEFSAYKSSIAAATARGKDELRARLMRQFQREKLVWWNNELDKMRAEVGAEVDAQPIYQAFDALTKGELPDGTPFKIDKQGLIDQFGKAYVKKLPRGYGEGRGAVFSTDGQGIRHDAAADLLGYGSGAELVEALVNMRPRKELIEAEAKKRMVEKHGDLLTDGTIADEATAALHNEERGNILRTELVALRRKQRGVAPFVKIEADKAKKEADFAKRERDYERRWLEAEKNLALDIERGIAAERLAEVRAEIADLKEQAAQLKKERAYELRWMEAERNTADANNRQAAMAATDVPPASAFRDAARGLIGQAAVRDIKPYPYLLAERKASKAAFKAMAKGDHMEAATQKQRELLNHYLYLEATKAQETVDDIYTYARKFTKTKMRAKFGKAGASYLEQIDDLLDQYEFASVPNSDIVRREKLLQFIKDKMVDDEPVMIPDSVLLDAQKRNYKTLPFDQLLAVRDAIKNIEHMVDLKTKLLKIQAKRALEEVVNEGAASIEEYGTLKPAPIGTRTWLDSVKEIRDGYFAAHRKIASLFREMDGWKDDGFMWNTFMKPINDAATDKAVRTEDATKKLMALYAKLQKPGLANKLKGLGLLTKEYYPSLGRSLSKSDILALALNYGNEGNRQRIRDGYGWTDQQVLAALNKLEAHEWDFVQGTWDLIDSYWPEISAQDKRINGIEPAKVERSGFVLPNGRTIEGGYYPIKYDERHSVRSYTDRAKEEADRIMRGAVARPGVDTGFTEARAGKVIDRKIKLDLGVGLAHIDTVLQTLTHREMLIDINKILGSPKINGAILEHYGIETYKAIQEAIVDIAAGEIGAQDAFEKGMGWLRSGVTVAGLGLNITTAFMQPLGITQSMVRIGPKWAARGVARFIGDAVHMENSAKFVYEKSDMMRLRSVTQSREISEIRNKISKGGVMPAVEEAYFYAIVKMQAAVDIPTWLGAYEKYMEQTGNDEPKAIALANQAVVDAQGGGETKDLASIQRGGPLKKLFTTFYSYFSALWNLSVESASRTDFKKVGDVGRFSVDMLLLYTIPVVLTAMLKEAVTGKGGPDDDEEWYLWLAKEQLSFMAGSLVGLREISSAIQGMYGYSGPAGTRFFSEASKLIKQAGQGEADAALVKAANNTAGILFHYPAGQVQRTVEGFMALQDGTTRNPAALLFGPPKDN